MGKAGCQIKAVRRPRYEPRIMNSVANAIDELEILLVEFEH